MVEDYALPDRKGRGIFDDFQDAAVESGLGEVLHRVESGYGEQTPTGAQFLYRCAEVSQGQVLAQQPATARERKLNLRAEPRTLFSTVGEGEVIAVTPTWRKNHQLDDWELLQGGFDTDRHRQRTRSARPCSLRPAASTRPRSRHGLPTTAETR